MSDSTVLPGGSVNKLVQDSKAWIGLVGAIISVPTFCVMLGMCFGPLRDMPAQFATILAQLQAINGRMDKSDWAIDALKSKTDAMGAQMARDDQERSRIWDNVRKIETVATRLSDNTLSREMFIEWKAALENRNRNISAPPLTTKEKN